MSDALSGRKKYTEDSFRMKKLISLLIAVLMVFGLLPVLSAPATHASADSSDGYGDFKSASHPADTLRGFSYFYHDSKFMGGPYGWVSMASGNPEGANFISDFTESGYVAGEFYNGYVYGYRYAEESNYHFCKVNAFTFEETILGTSEAVAADMAYDYSTDTMYAVSGDLLCTVNLSDGSLTEVGFVGPDAMLALACSTDGQLYGIGDDCNLYAIEKTEGMGEVCGFTGVIADGLQSMAWDHNTDTLYWASCATTPHLFTYYTTMGNLCELNTIDGTATVIGNIYGSKMQVTCLYSVPDFYDAPEFPLTDMHLNLDTSYMVPGQTTQLSAYMEPANAERGVTWATSNPNIVRVDNCGKMTAVATGTALVTAQSIDGSKIKTCTVNVVSSTDGLTLDDAVNGTGSNYTYNNAANYPFETEIRDGRLCAASTMTVQGEALLQVDLGTLTAGSVVRFDWKTDTRYMFHGWILWFNNDYVANLTGSTGWLTYEYVIPVTGQYVITWNLHKDNSPVDGSNMSWVDNLVVESQSTSPVEGVNVTPETTEMYTGGQLALNAEVYPSNVADASVSWSSSNESVATVNSNGVVTAVAPGTADIIAATTEGGFTDSCSLTVVDSAVIDAPISDALNVSGGSLVFSNDTAHPWAVDSETFAGRTAAKSTINGMAGTSTGIRLNAGTLHAGDRLSFDWLASSEGGTWDYAAFIVNGNVEATTGGTDNDWANFIYTVPADGEYIFEWTYQKDGSRDQGDDCVYVDEVCILPAVGVLGDVDGDGTVTISDALMIMRNAMQLLEFTPAQTAAADMDGDGLITVEDALTALRAAITVR